MPGRQELPSTIERSPQKAQRTWIKAHDSAVEQYGEGRRAHQTAYDALKRGFEKVGDHWEAKGHKGASDKQAAKSGAAARRSTSKTGAAARRSTSKTAGGVDANAPKSHLVDVARKLDISGRTRMTKDELVKAIQKANRRKTASARS